jgi:endonuclease/exonuclease/phosphatase family metal-dependent hydrolase
VPDATLGVPTERTANVHDGEPVPRGSQVFSGGILRVATLNVFGLRENWQGRRHIVRAGLTRLRPDLVSLQEVVARADYDQARDVLGSDYHIAHHPARQADGQGDSIASLWPVIAVHEVDVRCVENGPTLHIRSCDRFLDEPEDGVWGSDHFGVTAELTAFTPMGHSAPQPR